MSLQLNQCAPCTAAWGDIDTDCAETHDEKHLSLAEALALAFNPWDTDDERLEHIGWFVEDAEQIIGQGLEGPPWKVKVITLAGPVKFSVNGKFCVMHEGEKGPGFVEVFGMSDQVGESE